MFWRRLIHAGAPTIVTWNLKDFPRHILELHGIEARTPDDFLLSIWPTQRSKILDGLRTQRASLVNPPQSPAQFLESLACVMGLTQFVAALRARADEL